MYTSRLIPPMSNGRSYRVLPKPSCQIMLESPSAMPNRVCVNTVHKQPISGPSGGSALSKTSSSPPPSSVYQLPSSANTPSKPQPNSGPSLPRTTLTTVPKQSGGTPVKKPLAASPSSASPDGRPMRTAVPLKKDPMASLFVPKHRAYSQRPV